MTTAKQTLKVTSPIDGAISTRTTAHAYTHACAVTSRNGVPCFIVTSWHSTEALAVKAAAQANIYAADPRRPGVFGRIYTIIPVDPA